MTVGRRTRITLAGGLALVAAGVTVLVVLSRVDDGPDPAVAPEPPPAAGSPTAPEPIATSKGPFASGPVGAPPVGAYLGAWVRPASLTQPGRIAAVDTWEQTLGRRMNIVNTYRRLEEDFFTESDLAFTARGSTLMLSWTGGDTRITTLGRHDATIRDRARKVRAFGRPLLVRYRWEMDRPNLRASMWSPEDYVASWRYVRRIFTEEGATNVSWVWCPTIEGFAGGYAQPFYPGDDAVDWICADIYAGVRFRTFEELARPMLTFATRHPTKPIMIGEYGVARAWGTEARAAWLRGATAVFKANPQIRAVVYFESDPTDNKGATQQYQISDDPSVLAAFGELAREPYFNPPAVRQRRK